MMIVFLFIAYLVILTGHMILYFFLSRSFFVSNPEARINLAIILLALSMTFLISSVLVHLYSSFLTRIFYTISGLWLGLMLNLIIAFSFSFFVYYFLSFLPFNLSLKMFSIVSVLLALLFSIYGVYNVYNIKIEEVNISRGTWPEVWKDKNVVFLSDVHLGETLGESFLERLILKINSLDPNIVLIGGDLFDGIDGHLEEFSKLIDKIEAREGIYFVSGNHETYMRGVDYSTELKKTKVHILEDELIEIDGVQIVGISYPEMHGLKNMTETLNLINSYKKEIPSILLFHEPKNIGAMKEAGINLMLSGHTHKGQMWPFGFVTKYLFKGADYGLLEKDDFSIYTSSGAGVWGPNMRTSGKSEIVKIIFN